MPPVEVPQWLARLAFWGGRLCLECGERWEEGGPHAHKECPECGTPGSVMEAEVLKAFIEGMEEDEGD